ncbi:acyltransferase [Streptomyces sp. HU2014]|uniref:acyltransferase family protein n=1 Tax=Streptomyces sp. HU2014 TaxID=2939414 RepID=UPI00200DADCB|nr:acyltransferase [Streptomyces sp. HU2014]UQI47281.1 acyltransferase [Streptomyces sp. HU2014]
MSLITPTPTAKPSGKPPASRVRLDSLTGLRWYAALFVACFHFAYEEASSGTSLHVFRLKEIVYAGPSAVSFFFILSGFVLAWSARPRDTVTGFWRRRFARIYPSHLVTFCVAVVTMIWMGKALDLRIALANLTLTQSWIPDRKNWWFNYNGVSWSLSCEFLFYLSFPLVIKLVRRLSDRGLWATVVVGNLLVVLAPLYMKSVERAFDLDPKFLLYVFPPMRLVEFVIGIAVALLVKKGSWRGPGLTTGVALAVLAALGPTHLMPFDFHWAAVTVVPYTLTIAAAARADVRGEPSPFRNRINVYLGEVSFAFYLVHEIVIFSVDHFLDTHHLKIPLVLHLGLFLAVSFVGAVLVHEYVEKPGVKLLTRSRKKSRPITA